MNGTETLLKQAVERRLDQEEYQLIRDRMIGTLIQEARQDRGFTREYLAQQVGIDLETLTQYEYGQAGIPLSQLNDLADALHVTISYFLEGSDRVGKFIQAQALFRVFLDMEPELREFVSTPANHAYLELAMKFARMDTRKLREIAEMLLEITL
jgi:transcriptional regulator with XRE-family HTH domain